MKFASGNDQCVRHGVIVVLRRLLRERALLRRRCHHDWQAIRGNLHANAHQAERNHAQGPCGAGASPANARLLIISEGAPVSLSRGFERQGGEVRSRSKYLPKLGVLPPGLCSLEFCEEESSLV